MAVTLTVAPVSPSLDTRPYNVQSCDVVTWDFGDGTPGVTLIGAASTTHTYQQRGPYSLTVTVSNALGSAAGYGYLLATADPPARVDPSARRYSVMENAGSVTVGLQRTGNLGITSTIDWAVPCFQCTNPVPSSHLLKSNGTVTFAPGETTKTITLPVVNDAVYTGNTVDFIEVQAADGTIMGPCLTDLCWSEIDVTDDEPPPLAAIDDTTALRSSGFARFNVHMSAPMGVGATFNYVLTDQMAVNGVDYRMPSSEYAVIPAGATSTTIEIPILNDGVAKPDATFTITLFSWPPAPNIVRRSATCTIVNDNFFAPSSLTLPTGAHATLIVDSVVPFPADTVVPLTTSDASVIAAPPSVTLQGGNSRASFDVTALQAGTASVNVSIRGLAGQARIAVIDPAAIVAKPAALQMRAGDDATVTLSMTPPSPVTKYLSVEGTATLVQVPSSVAIPPGGSAGITVHTLRAGGGAIAVTDPSSGATTSIAVDVVSASAPLVTAVSPNAGSTLGGTQVTLVGSHFDAPCAVSFGAAAGSAVDARGDALGVVTPAHAEGTVDLVVTCGSDQVTLPQAFTFTRGRRRSV